MKTKTGWGMIVALSLAVAGLNGANLLENGDFEQGLKGWGKEASPEPATIERDGVFAGKMACKLFREGDGAGRLYKGLTGFDPKKPLKISMAVKCDGVAADDFCVRLLCHGADGKPIRWTYLPAESGMHDLIKSGGTHPWKMMECVLEPGCHPAGTVSAILFLDRKTNGTGKVWVDEIEIEHTAPAKK